mgnify:CR=1 FL=1
MVTRTASPELARLLKPLGVRVTRLAFGLPVGAAIEFAEASPLPDPGMVLADVYTEMAPLEGARA